MELKKKEQMISGNRNPIPVHSQVKKIKEEECSSESPGGGGQQPEMRPFLRLREITSISKHLSRSPLGLASTPISVGHY
ncbi:hypothetical protein Patl1_19564 [Pistacia atlantica]|uniref:Uncharacterized protein n=1 Tax=Pistacia atlantica TaxID=434234 RepID=A0ACC1C0S4_9ROSI|nr:hypothetical protein Patl1_19564 [Pistacia atlantica]